jgi:colanic acid/amylovoran biosynthesis glycosyltransferase
MPFSHLPRVGYVLKRYPRYSETFIVNEILAHETAGLEIEIFALRPSSDTHFQDIIARVRAPVHYLPAEAHLLASDFWMTFAAADASILDLRGAIEAARGAEARDVHQAVLLAKLSRQHGIQHLHAHFGSVATTVARLAARFAGLPYSFTAHAKDIFHQSVQPDDMHRKLHDAATVVTVSDYNVDYLRQVYGPVAQRVTRIYNGLDLDRFPYMAPDNRPPLIVAVGRLVEKKGFADLVEACAILVGRGRHFTCQIVGAGPLEGDLREQIDRLGLEGRVELTGPRPQGELVAYVQHAAAFVAPCTVGADGNRDGLPTVLLEAMALGTPCVSTDVTGIPEVLHHGETGLMVPQRNPAALADALQGLLAEPAWGARLARRARRLIETEFDIRHNAARLRDVFQHASETKALMRQEAC